MPRVQHVQAVARRAARRQRQRRVGDHMRLGAHAAGGSLVVLILRQRLLAGFGQQVPVGDGDQAVAGGLQSDLRLGADVAPHELGKALAPGRRDEQLGMGGHVGAGKIAAAVRAQLAQEGIEQALVDDQARGDHQEVAGKAWILPAFFQRRGAVEHLPHHQGLQHPGLAGAGGHLQAVLGVGVLGLVELGQQRAAVFQQCLGAGLVVEVGQTVCIQHFVGDDGVEDGLALARVEVERAAADRLVRKPPAEQDRGGRRDQLQQLGIAAVQAQ